MSTVHCIGCGALVPDASSPVHRYIQSSPGCWTIYGDVLAREYSDPAYTGMHRLTVDTYAVQHPGTPSPQSTQSVAIHLLRLCLILEHGYSEVAAGKAMPILAQQKQLFCWLSPPASVGDKTVLHVWSAQDAAAHRQAVPEWADSAWRAWVAHHEQVRRWLPKGV